MSTKTKTRKGRKHLVPFLRNLIKLNLISSFTGDLLLLRVVYSELVVNYKEL